MVMEFDYNQILENVQLNNIILSIAGDGVVSGLDVSQRAAGVNMSVDVATGSCKIDGTTYTEISIVNLAISAADTTHARKDLVTYDSATSNPVIIAGTPATPPIPPDIPADDILLAIVNVAANETEITNSEIVGGIMGLPSATTLGALTDVVISSVADKEFLTYNSGASNWINRTPAEAGIAALSGFTMAGAIDLANYNITGANEIRAYDANGIDFDNSGGVRRIRLALTSWAFAADADADMGSNQIKSVADPTAAQDAATKNWVENTAVIDAAKVDGCDAGDDTADVWKIPNHAVGVIYQHSGAEITGLATGTSGYRLTTRGSGLTAVWSSPADLIFSDTHCPKCGQEFQDGDDLVLHVIGHNEVGDILTIPMHLSCANQPKKTVTLKRKVTEDRYILNEDTGEMVVQRVQKTREKTVTRHKLKEGYSIDAVTGRAHKVNDKGNRGKAMKKLADALETVEETITEEVYEDVEYWI